MVRCQRSNKGEFTSARNEIEGEILCGAESEMLLKITSSSRGFLELGGQLQAVCMKVLGND